VTAVAERAVSSDAPASAAARFEAVALGHRYGSRVGLETVEFSIASPGLVAVTGANGAGKSTLLRILAGLLRPSLGESRLLVNGVAVPPAARRAHVGYAAPSLHFYDELTARENLAFAAEALGLAAPAERARVALERASLASRADDLVSALSSGMQQRLRLAFAMLQEPPVLLLDEPGNHLDDEGRALLDQVIERQAREHLVILATNDEREWRRAAQRIELRGGGVGRPA
jgi:heme exporter protein A